METWLSKWLADEDATISAGKFFGSKINGSLGLVVYLRGHLGAGKTTFTRGVLASRGYQGAVKSPTYTLVEPYELPRQSIYHFDLYRLGEPEELEYMGIRDYFDKHSLCLVEWDERGLGVLPEADIIVSLEKSGVGRQLTISLVSKDARQIIRKSSS